MTNKVIDYEIEDLLSSFDEEIEKPKEYWCDECRIETRYSECPVCGKPTVEGIPIEIYWCKHCSTPIIHKINQIHFLLILIC